MTYVDKNLVPGETLLYQTRHHWIVLLLPVLVGLLLSVPGAYLLMRAFMLRSGPGVGLGSSTISPQGMAIVGGMLLFAGVVTFSYGIVRRNATEMAVTNRRVLIKTGLASRKTIEMLLNKVESIEVSETTSGRMLGYGTIVVIGTGGTPQPFHKVAHPLEFRSQVQQQIEKLK